MEQGYVMPPNPNFGPALGIFTTTILVAAALVAYALRCRPGRLEAVGLSMGAALVLLYCHAFMPFVPVGEPQVIATAAIPDVVECLATQTAGGGPCQEINVAFYTRRPGEPWVWHYIDHEDIFWWHGSIELDPERGLATLYRGRERVAALDYRTDEYLLRNASEPRTGDVIAGDPLIDARLH